MGTVETQKACWTSSFAIHFILKACLFLNKETEGRKRETVDHSWHCAGSVWETQDCFTDCGQQHESHFVWSYSWIPLTTSATPCIYKIHILWFDIKHLYFNTKAHSCRLQKIILWDGEPCASASMWSWLSRYSVETFYFFKEIVFLFDRHALKG